MLLTLQIAAGIVLAYAVIANRHLILKAARWLAGGLAALAFLGFLIWQGSKTLSAASPSVGKIGRAHV